MERYKFDEKLHAHTLDGKPLTGITTALGIIAKPQLIPWAAKMTTEYISEHANKVFENDKFIHYEVTEEQLTEAKAAHRKKKEAAGDSGTLVHAEIEKIIKYAIETDGYIVGENDAENEQVKKFIEWAQENKVKFLESEKNLYSETLWIGGICDIVCEIDGKRYVGDVKTSSGIYPEAFIQASAYAKMLCEMELYEKFDGVIILNCKKTGEFEFKYNFDLEGNFQCFLAALTLFRHLNALKK